MTAAARAWHTPKHEIQLTAHIAQRRRWSEECFETIRYYVPCTQYVIHCTYTTARFRVALETFNNCAHVTYERACAFCVYLRYQAHTTPLITYTLSQCGARQRDPPLKYQRVRTRPCSSQKARARSPETQYNVFVFCVFVRRDGATLSVFGQFRARGRSWCVRGTVLIGITGKWSRARRAYSHTLICYHKNAAAAALHFSVSTSARFNMKMAIGCRRLKWW